MTTPSAGWYPDPDGSPRSRWWSGIAWTESYSDAQPPATGATAPVAAPLTAPVASSPYVASLGAPMVAPAGTPWNTGWIWLIVFLPMMPTIGLLFVDFKGMFSYSNMMNEMAMTQALFTSPAYLFVALSGWVFYGLSVLFSYFDYRELTRRGVPSPFHWAFAFISSIVYVIGRSVVVRRRTGKGISPMWVTIVTYVLANIIVSVYMVWVVLDFVGRMPTFRG